MAKKIPSNFYQEVNIRKLDKVFSNEGDLPTPSVSDEGKVIKVNNEGKYALLPDGGAQTMTVVITYDETTEDYSADKTHAEIVAALQAGVIVKATYSDQTFVYAGTNKPAAFDGVYFTYIQADSEDQLICKCFEIDSDNRIVYSSHNISEELPVVTSLDVNTLLQVNSDGQWAKGIKIPDLHIVGNNHAAIQSVLLDENGIILAVPRIQVGSKPWTTIDNDGYYTITKCSLSVLTAMRTGVVGAVKPSDFDVINVCGATSMYVGLFLNDGTSNIWLVGNTNCRNDSISSSDQSSLVTTFQECFLENKLKFTDIYKPYDVTLTYNNDVDNPYDWTLKFKLEKITTT